MAGMLNLRRTMLRLVQLATERFAGWAQLSVVDRDRVVTLSSDVPGVQTMTGSAARSARRDLVAGRVSGVEPVDGAAVHLTQLPQAAAVEAVLALREPVRHQDELADFLLRAGRALAAAVAHEQGTALADALRAAVAQPELAVITGVDVGAAYRPAQQASQVGGDFYELLHVGGSRWSLTLGDVCGKGIGAAVMTGRVRQSLRTAARVTDEPARMLDLVNETLIAGGGDTFVTMLTVVLSATGAGVEAALATGGHPAPLLLRGHTVSPVEVRGTLVGMRTDATFGQQRIVLAPGDLLLGYTDGASEAHAGSRLLGEEPLSELLADCAGLPAQTVVDRMMQLVMEHVDGGPHDDVAFVAVRPVP